MTRAEIEQRLGEVPPWLASAEGSPQLLAALWAHARDAYLDNPMPALLKEELLAYLARCGPTRYSLVHHTCALADLGVGPLELLGLLTLPAPGAAGDVADDLSQLAREPLRDWPAPGTPLRRALLRSAAFLGLAPGASATACRAPLRAALGPERFAQLVVLLGFARAHHLWVEAEGLDPAADPRLAARLAELVRREPALEEVLQTSLVEPTLRDLAPYALDAAPVGVVVADQRGRVVLLNAEAEALTGYGRGELVGRELETLIPERKQADHRVHRSRYLAAPAARVVREALVRRKDGAELALEVRLTPLETSEGLWVLASLTDLRERWQAEEERRRLEAQIQQAQKLESLGVLAGGIAHDFNNILVGVLGYADLALRELSPSSPSRPLLLEIKKAGQQAADLCTQMLAYSGKGRFVVQAVDLRELVEEMSHLLEASVSKKAMLKYQFGANLPAIEADVTQVRQVLLNLVVNASEAIGSQSGIISITTGAMECDHPYLRGTFLPAEELREGLYVYLEVSDTGSGMDEAVRARIFDPFFTTKFTGRGLGLAAVLGIARGHRAALKVYSEPGQGTTFKILFPASEQRARPLRGADVQSSEWRGQGAILLVDDDETVRAVGAMVLRRAGFDVLTAPDGRAAIDLFRARRPDVVCVVLDLMMPHMDGEEAFRELRRVDPSVRVVLSSGYNEQDVTHRFAGKGLAGFVKKPYEAESLLAIIRAALGQG